MDKATITTAAKAAGARVDSHAKTACFRFPSEAALDRWAEAWRPRIPWSNTRATGTDFIIRYDEPAPLPDFQVMAYKLAKHLKNADKLDPLKWGFAGIDLLSELRDMDPEAYDAHAKGGLAA